MTGVLVVTGIFILRTDSPRLFHDLLGRGLPLVLAAAAAGLAALFLLPKAAPRLLQLLAVAAVTAVVAGWGVAQYPYLLGTHLQISQGAAPVSTLVALAVVAGVALVLVVPAFALLLYLQQRGHLRGT